MRGSSTPGLAHYRDADLTLDELVRAATRLLRRLDLHPGDGRVAETIDARGVRYYQAIGVLDRPVRYDGRRAVYGYRHLLQLLSAKRLQQEGHPLQLIQRALAGRQTERLERALAAMLSPGGERPPLDLTVGGPDAERAVLPSDLRRPEDVSNLEPTEGRASESPVVRAAGAPRQPSSATSMVAAKVAPGVTVTIDPAVVAEPERLIEMIARALARG
jgi:DNA-binding transcriptional MerR regulator